MHADDQGSYTVIMELVFEHFPRVTPCLFLTLYAVLNSGSVVGYRTDYPDRDLNIVKEWSDDLSRKLIDFSKTVTYYNDITAEYVKSTSETSLDGGDTLVKTIAEDIKNLLKEKLDAVLALAEEAERIYQNYTYDQDLDIDYLNSKKLLSSKEVGYITQHSSNEVVVEMAQQARTLDLTPDKQFNNEPVNHDHSTVHVPTNVYDRFPKILNGAYWTEGLNEKFKENEQKDKSLRWQYFCSTDGFFRVFPGMKWPRDNENGIDIYDCRVRTWYLQAATCPKNVLILLDSSGSMKGSRMAIARSTVKKILNTLDDDDYFNIIRFSDTVDYIDSCFNKSMMPATTQNKRRLQEIVEENVTARNTADFKRAFDTAFHLLNSSERKRRGKKLCNKAILLITDGVPEHYDDIFKYWTSEFQNITTRVFTFLIGREVDDDREVRWMACANRGYYSHISTLADVQENVQNYIKVMSRQMVIDRYRNTIWTSVYLDHMSYLDTVNPNKGLQFMTSVAIPVFDKKNETFYEGNLLGVMGTDIPIELIKERIPIHKLGANGYAFMINHNGYVLMHPDYRPFKKIAKTKEFILHPYYKNVDLTEIALPVKKNQFLEIVRGMLSEHEKFGSQTAEMMSHYQNMKRMVKRNYNIHRCKVEGTDFSIGIALPSTSMKTFISADIVPSLIDNTLSGTDIEIAPWFYCSDLDPALTGRKRIEALKKLYKPATNRNCNDELLSDLIHDVERLNRSNLRQKWGRQVNSSNEGQTIDLHQINESLSSNGIELLFLGTTMGLTKYVSTNETVPEFIQNNTNTLESVYYKRAVEGIERIDGQPSYTFTYSVPILRAFDPNLTLVTGSAPIMKRNEDPRKGVPTVFAVVGLQMKYEKYQSIFQESTRKTQRCSGEVCACDEPDVNCYLVDNHGYVTAKTVDAKESVGYFFGEVENSVMAALVRTGIFQGYNFTDYQALCDIMASDKDSNSATYLLNPIKTILNGLFWTITEIFMFISEFSLSSLWTSLSAVHAVEQEQAECDQVIAEYDYDDLAPRERLSYNLIKMTCASESAAKKVLGHRPCHRRFRLYRADFRKLIKSAIHGYVQGCTTDYSSCMYEGCTGTVTDKYPFVYVLHRECKIPYYVSWVKDTNLLLVVVSRKDCGECIDAPVHEFGLAFKEIIESEEKDCEGRKRSKYVDTKFPCSDSFKNETLACGSEGIRLSSWLLLTTVTFGLMRYSLPHSL